MSSIFFNEIKVLLSIAITLIAGSTAAFGNPQYQIQKTSSAEISAEEEKDFQEQIDSFFENSYSEIDTFAWSSSRINSGRIDCSYLFDTVKVALVDEALGKKYVHPFMGNITSDFGKRDFGFWHYGVDIKLNTGDTVKAAFDGIVRAVINDRYGYGNVVVIRHCWGVETIYGHLSKAMTKPNQKIKAGEVIGLGGNTGRSSGSHLHFEMRYYGEPFDPNYIIDFRNFTLKNDTLKLYKDNFAYLKLARTIVHHNVRKGDCLGKIARQYGVSINKICMLNGINAESVLRIGRRLIVRAVE